ncbi:MAG TPA: PAS domain S-box protein [Polyangiaceae bacterium]|jgi:PAS domain S-box-containing protein
MAFSTLAQKHPQGLRDFWNVYDARQEELRVATLELARSHPVFGPMIAAMSPADMERNGAESRALLQRAMTSGKWDEYVASLEAQGTTYARMNIPFGSWLDIIRVVHRVMVPALAAEYGATPERVANATLAMLDFVDEGMAIIADRYSALRADDRFQMIVEAVKDYAIFMLDPAGRVATWNSGAHALKGWTTEEVLGKSLAIFYPPEERDRRPAQTLETAKKSGRCVDEGWRVRKDGTRFWASVLVTAMRDARGELVGFAKVTRDLSDRKRVEEALRASEESLATTLLSIGDGVIATDTEGRVTRMNPVAERLTGWSIEDARGRDFTAVFHIVNEITGEVAVNPIERVLREGVVVGLANHTSLIARDGSVRPIADSAAPIRRAREGLQGVVLVFRDMTAERDADRALREAHSFLDSIIENIPHMIFVKDAAELRFQRFNRAGEALLGATRDVLVGKNDFDFFPKEQAEAFTRKDREVLASQRALDIVEEPIDTPKGKRWLNTKKIPIRGRDGKARYLLGISEDVTERKEMVDRIRGLNEELERRVEERTTALRKSEDQLRHAQKMEAIGRLAGGVAHDFNNLLSVILSYGELMQGELPADDPLCAELAEIRRAAQRAADLTRQLLAFSRQQVLAPKVIDLNQTIAGMGKLVGRLIGEDIDVRTVPSANLGNVLVDPGQIEQVLMNLVVNARDAMPKGGTLTIETMNVDLDAGYASDHDGVTAGPHVMIAVTDTGHGMDKATIARIFEPFFTTKEAGKGTGLGLSTVFGIVKQSGGHIWVYSEIGKGTTFKLYFPRAQSGTRRASVVGRIASPRGTERILLVEDEDQVRALAKAVLARQGYEVHAAENGNAALALFDKLEGKIDLLLTDVVMPKMSGRELAEKLAPIRPELKVLFMSGYTDDTVVHHGVLDSGIAFLQKPITPDALARKVREVLDGRQG